MSGPDRSPTPTGRAPNGKPYESVWDYPRPPRLEPVDWLIEVSHRGVTVARSTACLRVLETSQPPAYYVPIDDVAAELLRPGAGATVCEWKGVAAYADVVVPGGDGEPDGEIVVPDAAWTYPDPTPPFARLRNHWAFYAQKLDDCRVDGEPVDPNEGAFYGGWITANVTGPFKGGAGTSHW